MSIRWTIEQAMALAPDARSLSAAEKLAQGHLWGRAGRSDDALWGEHKGSGRTPYQTAVDLTEPAFRCSCPSRKFPCKHGLGLFLLYVRQPDLIAVANAPGWVADWLDGRRARASRSKTEASSTAPDLAAQTRRAEQRHQKILDGLAELELWLGDLARRGLAFRDVQTYGYWERMAARMVDAQAPGMARELRQMAGMPGQGEGWQERLLMKVGLLYLLVQGYQRLEALAPETQADIKAAVGWSLRQAEIATQPGQRDYWLVVGRRIEEEEGLRTQRTWLWGTRGRQPALILEFAYRNQPLDASLSPGMGLEASLAFYPTAAPLRAIVQERHDQPLFVDELPGHPSLSAAVDQYAALLTLNPWIERVGFPINNVTPLQADAGLLVRDKHGSCLPLVRRFARDWELLALSGGQPVTLIAEWDGAFLLPLSVVADGRLVML